MKPLLAGSSDVFSGSRCGPHPAGGSKGTETCTWLNRKTCRGQEKGEGSYGKGWYEGAPVNGSRSVLYVYAVCNCCIGIMGYELVAVSISGDYSLVLVKQVERCHCTARD